MTHEDEHGAHRRPTPPREHTASQGRYDRTRLPGQHPAPRTRQAARRHRADEVRRALLLIVLSTILPGLGLLFTRKKRRGALLVVPAVALIVVLCYILLHGGLVEGAASLLTSRGLLLLLVICVGGGLLWLASIVLTAREVSGRGWPAQTRWLHRGFATLMCLIIGIPAANAAHYVLVTQDTFGTMFHVRYDGRGHAVHTPGTGSNPWAGVPRVNLLLLGSDAGPDRTGVRTDSMMVVSVDTKTGDSTLISIPRNFQHVPFPADNPLHKIYPDGFYCPQRGIANACMMDAVWTEAGVNHRNLFPKNEANPGLDTTREVISQITGLSIDYTTVIDLKGFQQLVDAMGGVWMNVPKPPPGSPFDGIPIGGVIKNGVIVPGSVTGLIKPGYQKLDGREALWYSRSRVGAANGDDDRMRRQRCMVNALISQTNPFSMITKFTGIMKVAKKNITLDIPQDKLPAFAELVDRMKNGNVRTVNISAASNHVDPDFAKIRSLIHQAIGTPHDKLAPTPGHGAKAPSSSSPAPTTTTESAISNTASSC